MCTRYIVCRITRRRKSAAIQGFVNAFHNALCGRGDNSRGVYRPRHLHIFIRRAHVGI